VTLSVFFWPAFQIKETAGQQKKKERRLPSRKTFSDRLPWLKEIAGQQKKKRAASTISKNLF